MIHPVHIGAAKLYHGDAAAVLPTLDADSFDAMVCDPPAGIAFMGKAWDRDHGGRDHWVREYAAIFAECLRVLKPGAHGLVWALPRTSHWTAMALEDAGFELRDRVAHLFGSGFPKSLNVGAAIDKAAGAERTRLRGVRSGVRGGTFAQDAWSKENWDSVVSADPITNDARRWQGFGTALKPAVEDWWLVRKPLSEKNVAANVLRWGTGALNIDGCRIGTTVETWPSSHGYSRFDPGSPNKGTQKGGPPPPGRWPANLILGCACDTDAHEPDCAVALLDAQSGPRGGAPGVRHNGGCRSVARESAETPHASEGYADKGGASRFFYCSKAPRSDRGEGNTHPTVKNTALMRYLCRLVTPPGGVILDAFAGSGSTLVAAVAEGFRAVGIEQDANSIETAARRLVNAQRQAALFEPHRFESQPTTGGHTMKHLTITVALLAALALPGCGARNIFTEPVDTAEGELAIGLLEDLGVEAGAFVLQEHPEVMPQALLALEAAEAAMQTDALTTEQLASLAVHIPGTRGVRILRIAVRLKQYADAKTGFLQPDTIGYEAALAILRGFRLGVGV